MVRTRQKPKYELLCACAKNLGIRHEIITVACGSLGSGDMAQSAPHPAAPTSEWWPYRNQLLLTVAGMRAIARSV